MCEQRVISSYLPPLRSLLQINKVRYGCTLNHYKKREKEARQVDPETIN